MRLVVAHDFGKLRDFAAQVVAAQPDARPAQISFAERLALGTTYRVQAEMICARLGKLRQQAPQAKLALVVDATGVGQGACEFLHEADVGQLCDLFLLVTFSGGKEIKRGRTRHELSVPKTLLIQNAQRALSTGWLTLPPATAFPAAVTLRREFATYAARPTVRGGYRAGARRACDHDDLISAFLLASFALALDWARL